MMNPSIYDFTVIDIHGAEIPMSRYQGKILLIVNTASKCGFTPQYEGLETLHKDFGEREFTVLGFPCNQFGQQEPGNEGTISQFCTANFGVTFPLFSKIEVNGPGAHPLYKYLKTNAPGLLGTQKIKWNFTKFLVNSAGEVVKRYSPTDKPATIRKDIEKLL